MEQGLYISIKVGVQNETIEEEISMLSRESCRKNFRNEPAVTT